jgi:hypothetical protein
MTVERHSNGLLMILFGFARVPRDTKAALVLLPLNDLAREHARDLHVRPPPPAVRAADPD